MHKYAFSLFRGYLDEIKDVLSRLIVLVEEYLALNVLPKEGQVDNAETLPLVLNLFA